MIASEHPLVGDRAFGMGSADMSSRDTLAGWDAPFEEAMLTGSPVPPRGVTRRILAGLATAGHEVDGLVKLDLRLVSDVLRLWEQECCAGLELDDDEPLFGDDEDAWQTLRHLYETRPERKLILDENAASLICEASEQVAAESFVRETAEGEPPEELHAMGRWATARSEQGDHSAALEAYAYIQEQADPDDLDWIYFNRASLFMEQSNFRYALTDIQTAIEILTRKSRWPDSRLDPCLTECYKQLAEIDLKLEDYAGATEAISQFIDSLAAHAELPRAMNDGGMEYCLGDEQTHIVTPRACLANDLAKAIEFIKRLAAEMPADLRPSLGGVKAQILALRETLEEHWREELRAAEEEDVGVLAGSE